VGGFQNHSRELIESGICMERNRITSVGKELESARRLSKSIEAAERNERPAFANRDAERLTNQLDGPLTAKFDTSEERVDRHLVNRT
jgi:hypothetical protein